MKIGIYGGSFSPPHKGHIRLLERFMEEIAPERMLVIPAGIPPHKRLDSGASPEMRLRMCESAFLPLSPAVEISDFEIYRSEPCYTVDTLRHYSAEGELFLLMGSDMFLSMDSWREPEVIFSLCTLVCAERVGGEAAHRELLQAAEDYEKRYSARTRVMTFEPYPMSSTKARAALGSGTVPSGITDGVMDIIREARLYGWK